jgi:hypothetical protein
MNTVPTPTTALALHEINPAGFDFWLRDDVFSSAYGNSTGGKRQ